MPPMKTIAITRPGEDGLALCEKLASQGHKAFHVPMLRIDPVESSRHQLAELLTLPPQALCVTSKHALHALAQQPDGFDIPLYAVGQATAQAARNSGFTQVLAADDNAASLVALMLDHCKRDQGPILYVRGREVTRDIAAELSAHSFAMLQLVVYEAHPLSSLPPEFVQALKQESIDEIWFFSRASASNYVQLVMQGGLGDYHRRVTGQCVSDQVAAALAPLSLASNRILSMAALTGAP